MSEDKDAMEELAHLEKQRNPPRELENRIVSSLMSKGLLDRRRFNWIPVVAAVLMFGLGIGIGRVLWKSPPVQYSHILLLKEDPARFKANGHEASLVGEYTNWAKSMRQKGIIITGEKLAAQPQLILSGTSIQQGVKSSNEVIAGFFLLSAATDESALKESQGCPHLRHGGTIELRRIDTKRN